MHFSTCCLWSTCGLVVLLAVVVSARPYSADPSDEIAGGEMAEMKRNGWNSWGWGPQGKRATWMPRQKPTPSPAVRMMMNAVDFSELCGAWRAAVADGTIKPTSSWQLLAICNDGSGKDQVMY
ncbi:hypothetical protein BV898_06194 [Hypsibius exemplaris]|uniref:Uncharacterized protein n=1 Tax=Hypsibius exemplaris TaxID=2072580 RepID=A0A1W0WXK5_HYPEX|nr:hypothetical protein BV898_06194 [Hypsibius exemplaris]